MNEQIPIGECNDYIGFHRILRNRKETLKISNSTLDTIAGTNDGYAGKLLSDPPNKKMGIITFGLILQALGLKILIVEDEKMMQRLATRMVERCAAQVRGGAVHSGGLDQIIEVRISRRKLRRLAAAGGKARWAKLSKSGKRRLALRMNRARWGR